MKEPDENVRPAKPRRDWLQLLIVPLALAVLGIIWGFAQWTIDNNREDRRIAADRAAAEEARQDATLQGYLNQMSGLMLDRNLAASSRGDSVRQVARIITLTGLRRLDGDRKGEVVRFLNEAGLLSIRGGGSAPISLAGADLRGADLTYLLVADSDFTEADLRGARFDGGRFFRSSFVRANLRGASFREVMLKSVDFLHADLNGAVFDSSIIGQDDYGPERDKTPVKFDFSCLSSTSFINVFFGRTSFTGSEGRGVDFSKASGLQWVDGARALLTGVRLDGSQGRPAGWGQEGPDPLNWSARENEDAKNPCSDFPAASLEGPSSIPGWSNTRQ